MPLRSKLFLTDSPCISHNCLAEHVLGLDDLPAGQRHGVVIVCGWRRIFVLASSLLRLVVRVWLRKFVGSGRRRWQMMFVGATRCVMFRFSVLVVIHWGCTRTHTHASSVVVFTSVCNADRERHVPLISRKPQKLNDFVQVARILHWMSAFRHWNPDRCRMRCSVRPWYHH